MPVAYVAVARRPGYPVTLVTTKEHVFARWDGPNERFNIEGSGQGLLTYDDEHYRHWPSELSQAELDSGAYLRSLTPAQELGIFMSARGYVLEDTGHKREATVAYAYAHMLDPKSIDNFDNLGRSVVRRLPEYGGAAAARHAADRGAEPAKRGGNRIFSVNRMNPPCEPIHILVQSGIRPEGRHDDAQADDLDGCRAGNVWERRAGDLRRGHRALHAERPDWVCIRNDQSLCICRLFASQLARSIRAEKL